MKKFNVQQAMRAAVSHHRGGRLAEAEALYRQVLGAQPNNADALNLLGSIAHEVGRHDAAIELIGRAIALNHRVAAYYSNLGRAFQALRRFDKAISSYQQALTLDPKLAEVYYNLGLAYNEEGNLGAAVDCYRKALAINPGIAFAYGNLGVALNRQDEVGAAIACYQKALELKPDYAEAHYNLGNALRRLGRLDEALVSFQHAVRIRPGDADAHFNLANTLSGLNRLQEAVDSFQTVLALRPEDAEAYSNLGDVYTRLGRLQEAVACCGKALAIDPDYAEAPYHLGNALLSLGSLDAAAACFEQAIKLKPDYAEAYVNLGNARGSQRKADEAVACYRSALAIRPDYAVAQSNLVLALIAQGKHDECHRYLQDLDRTDPTNTYSPRLFAMHYMAAYTPAEIFAAHRRYAEQYEAPLKSLWPAHANSRDPERRLKIGYVSPDFRFHPVAFFIEPILTCHDRSRVEVYCYSTWMHDDTFSERIAARADHWLPCASWSDETLAARIRADGIDILVDLAGHTQGARLLLFARKPAPVQVTYLGYPGSTGLSAMDYRLTTWDVDPAGNEAFHSERLYRLPHTLWCYRPPADMPQEVGQTPALVKGQITFGSMNNFSKVSPEAIALWGEVLRAIPGSRLVMTSVSDGSARELLRERFAAHGIEADRLTLHANLPSAEFRALSKEIDLALDPFPYAGTTTTCEALWMGIPVITLIGQTSVARSGYALLKTVGLEELCATNETDYVRIAVELARDLPRLNALRLGMRVRLDASPLRDEAGLARDIEQAYRVMWRHWCAS